MHIKTLIEALDFKIHSVVKDNGFRATFNQLQNTLPKNWQYYIFHNIKSVEAYVVEEEVVYIRVGTYWWLKSEYRETYQESGIVIDVEEDILEKAVAIFNGLPYDKRILVPLEIDDETFLKVAKAAHEQDITFNQFVTNSIISFIEDQKHVSEST